jgi:hypothetical protein
MGSKEIVTAASDPEFYMRVAFIALRVAQYVASEDPGTANHESRVAYSCRVIQGADNAILLAQHVASSNSTISGALETGGPDAVPDSDIEFALASIWDARAIAFATSMNPAPMMAAPPPPEPPSVVGAGYP